MFGLLKNKLAGFIKGLTGGEEKKQVPSATPAEIPVEKIPAAQEAEKKPFEQPIEKKPEPQPAKEKQQVEEKRADAPPEKKKAEPIIEDKRIELSVKEKISVPPIEKKTDQPLRTVHEEKQPEHSFDLYALSRRVSSEKREMVPKIGLGMAIKSFFSSEITIGEAEVSGLLDELELSLLEADVEYGVSMEVSSQLRARLVGMRVPKGEVAKKTREAISQVLESIMDSERKFDFVKRVQQTQKPAKILFVGPNGAGKTTTMAKISRMLSEHGLTSVFSASDTFRAAAIEQTEVHGERLGVKVIKSKYGADPSSVAFDAVNYARSHGIDVVLIDSAGRQDTNANLLSELKKINRVAKPDIKLYVGESISGNALIDQIKAFQEAIGIDGAILTKLDCDAKGGTAISIAKATGIPIIFLGIGQRYEDLIPFDPRKIAQEIMT